MTTARTPGVRGSTTSNSSAYAALVITISASLWETTCSVSGTRLATMFGTTTPPSRMIAK